MGAPLDDIVLVAVRRARELEGPKDVLLQVLVVSLPRGLFDDHAEEIVTGVVVAILVTRREVERLVLEQVEQLLVSEIARRVVPEDLAETGVAFDARRVREQVVHGDSMPLCRVVGEELGQVVVEAQLATLYELHDRGGGELLGDRAEAIDGLRRRIDLVLEVGGAVALGDDDIASLLHADGVAHGLLVTDGVSDDRVDSGLESGPAQLAGGRYGGGGQAHDDKAQRPKDAIRH